MGFVKSTAFLSLLFVVGCAALPEEPRQADAIEIVWKQTYGENGNPPAVEWMVNCLGPHNEPGVISRGVCVGGSFQGWYIELPWLGNYHDTQFAHELMHARQAKQGIYDYEHSLPEWQTTLPLANERLIENGL